MGKEITYVTVDATKTVVTVTPQACALILIGSEYTQALPAEEDAASAVTAVGVTVVVSILTAVAITITIITVVFFAAVGVTVTVPILSAVRAVSSTAANDYNPLQKYSNKHPYTTYTSIHNIHIHILLHTEHLHSISQPAGTWLLQDNTRDV